MQPTDMPKGRPGTAKMTGEQRLNVETFTRLIEEGFSAGNVDVVDEVFAEGFVEHQADVEPPNREGVKRTIAFLHAFSPDVVVEIEDVAAVGDQVWARLRGKGSHGGRVLGGPTGRSFQITIMDVCRFRVGKIVEHWGVPDRFSQMRQLGLLQIGPQPAAPAR